jgi:hypothetical protein
MGHSIFPLSPRKLISLADMMRFFVDRFLDAFEELEYLKEKSNKASSENLSDSEKEFVRHVMDKISPVCQEAGLEIAGDRIARINHATWGFPSENCSHKVLKSQIGELQQSISHELSKRKFVFIPADKEKYFENPQHLGQKVYGFFENARQEIKEAGNCFAAALYTACVLHCVRVVEFGMRDMARHLKAKTMSPLEYCDWSQVITALERKLQEAKAKPRGKSKSRQWDLYSRALSDCKALIETRNRVCHAREGFLKSEADTAMKRTEHFMETVCEILKK